MTNLQVLERIGGRDTPDTLSLFRQYLVDVVSSVSFGYHVGALGKWAMDSEDKLVTAIGDFPKRKHIVFPYIEISVLTDLPVGGILVRIGLLSIL